MSKSSTSCQCVHYVRRVSPIRRGCFRFDVVARPIKLSERKTAHSFEGIATKGACHEHCHSTQLGQKLRLRSHCQLLDWTLAHFSRLIRLLASRSSSCSQLTPGRLRRLSIDCPSASTCAAVASLSLAESLLSTIERCTRHLHRCTPTGQHV